MKELSIEEKAKAYDKVRDKIAIRFGSNVADEIFSQYEMSEDEKTRKELLAWLKSRDGQTFPIDRYNAAVAWLEKQGEQKPAWSEEDEYCIHQLIVFCENCMVPDSGAKRCAHWLNSLKDRVEPQPQKEWSEEDKEIIRSLLDIIYECHSYGKCALKLNEYSKLCDWLKSLKDRYTWKPSDEQRAVLNEVINFAADSEFQHWNSFIYTILSSLQDQLKKLI